VSWWWGAVDGAPGGGLGAGALRFGRRGGNGGPGGETGPQAGGGGGSSGGGGGVVCHGAPVRGERHRARRPRGALAARLLQQLRPGTSLLPIPSLALAGI
jgi:hypothetical protein